MGEGEKEEGSGAGLGDPKQQIAACEVFRFHKRALAWPCLPTSNVWQVAINWQQPHQDCTCLMKCYLVGLNLLGVVADQGYIIEGFEWLKHSHDD